MSSFACLFVIIVVNFFLGFWLCDCFYNQRKILGSAILVLCVALICGGLCVIWL